MEKKTMFIVGGVVLAVVLVAGGIFTFKQWDNSQPNINPKYTKCIEDAEALEQENEVIIAKVDGEIQQCTNDKLVTQGYTDGHSCREEGNDKENIVCNEDSYTQAKLQERGYSDGVICMQDYMNPVCEGERYNAEVEIRTAHVGRYNAEIEAYKECSQDREARLLAEGYEEGIPAIDCMKYLGEE